MVGAAMLVVCKETSMNDMTQAAATSTRNRLVGVVQIAGGALEVTFGSGMMAAPTGVTQVGASS